MDATKFAIGAGSLSVDGADIGGTTENGIVVTVAPNVHLHTSGKYGVSPVKATYLGMDLTLVIEIAEATLTHLKTVLSGANIVSDSRLQFGGVAGVAITGHVLVITPFDGSPSWTFKSAVQTGSIEMAYQIKNERIFKVTFTALVDSTSPENENLGKLS